MPAKKRSSRKKATSKKAKAAAARKKTTARKKKASKKKAAKSRAPVRKKPSGKKASRKKVSRKKAAKKAARKTTKKKAKKKASAGKKTSRKKARSKSAARPAAKKKAGKNKAKKKKARTGKAGVKATASRKRKPGEKLIHGIRAYRARSGEDYMNDEQLEHFREILLAWKRELMQEVDRTVHHMQDEASNFPDPNDRATQESEFGLELRTRDRERKLLKKIDLALERIDDGSYGYCEETGEEIGLKRLEARPVATLSVEAQERREVAEKQYRDRDDRYR